MRNEPDPRPQMRILAKPTSRRKRHGRTFVGFLLLAVATIASFCALFAAVVLLITAESMAARTGAAVVLAAGFAAIAYIVLRSWRQKRAEVAAVLGHGPVPSRAIPGIGALVAAVIIAVVLVVTQRAIESRAKRATDDAVTAARQDQVQQAVRDAATAAAREAADKIAKQTTRPSNQAPHSPN